MDICYSGGCKGADQVFGELAEKVGHVVKHFSFDQHSYDKKCNPETIIVLNELQLAEADKPLKAAAKLLGKSTGRWTYVKNLLRRNYWQIKDTERVYAITPFDGDGIPQGGTGWAVAMAILDKKATVYIYDVNKLRWFKFDGLNQFGGPTVEWIEINIPKPYGKYTGIGSHDLTPEGRKAIEELYQ